MNILLIHGWNYKNYYNMTDNIAWYNRMNFVNKLKEKYNVYYPDLPGFGKEKPGDSKKYTLEDYAKFINDYIINNNLKIDCIIAYSFGGAVALTYKKIFDKSIKLILISPAIIRNSKKSKKFIKTPKIFTPIRNKLRDFYLINIAKTKEMVYGDKFLRNTYQDIVRINMLPILEKLNYRDIKIIYGKDDDMVLPYEVYNKINNNFKKQITIIDGDHDIANTNKKELIKLIDESVRR